MKHNTYTNIERYKRDFDYLRIDKMIDEVNIVIYGNLTSDQIATVTNYIAQYFDPGTSLTFDISMDIKLEAGQFEISWS